MPDRVCHLIISSTAPHRGGMQEFGKRLARGLTASGSVQVVAHALNQTPEDGPGDGFTLKPLLDKRRALAAPAIPAHPDTLTLAAMPSFGYQIMETVLARSIEEELARRPEARHVIISTSLVRLGHAAQRLASTFAMPHIAIVTGSDFSRDLADPALAPAGARVIAAADWIVASNASQRAAIARDFDRADGISVLHGALPDGLPIGTWKPHARDTVTIVTDTGFSMKKSTQILIGACDRLVAEGMPLRLAVAGGTDGGETDFWTHDYTGPQARALRPWAEFNGHIAKAELEAFLLAGDIYCSASLAEGSSNAALHALALGMPMVCTATGSLPQFADRLGHWLTLVPPGDDAALVDALSAMAERLRDGTIAGPHPRVSDLREELSPEREVAAWLSLLDEVTGCR